MGLFHGQGFRYLFRAADLSDYSPPTAAWQSLFQRATERARRLSCDRSRRFRAARPYSLGTLAANYRNYHGDNSRMVFPVERFCHPPKADGCLQHAHQRSLYLLDVSKHDVLSPCRLTPMVSLGRAYQSNDVASGSFA